MEKQTGLGSDEDPLSSGADDCLLGGYVTSLLGTYVLAVFFHVLRHQTSNSQVVEILGTLGTQFAFLLAVVWLCVPRGCDGSYRRASQYLMGSWLGFPSHCSSSSKQAIFP